MGRSGPKGNHFEYQGESKVHRGLARCALVWPQEDMVENPCTQRPVRWTERQGSVRNWTRALPAFGQADHTPAAISGGLPLTRLLTQPRLDPLQVVGGHGYFVLFR